jgi:hypothetical protein
LATLVTKTDFYVDDLLTSCRTIEEAKQLQKELVSMLQRGGFDLHKRSSDAKIFLEVDKNQPKQPKRSV